MRVGYRIAIAAWLLVVGCSGSRSAAKSEAAKSFASNELHASFRVPARWAEAKRPWMGTPPYVARFEAPSDGVAIVLGQAPFTGGDCSASARVALHKASGATLSPERQFSLRTARGDLPAGQGRTSSGDRQGGARFFCFGRSAVVLEASAPKRAFTRRQGELETVLDTLTFDAGSEDVAIRAPAEPTPSPSYFIHVVKSRGQTLGRLAEWYTGRYENWPKLARANDETAANSPLDIGREIKIPSELVVRRDPPPAPRRRRPTLGRGEARSGEAPAESPSQETPSEESAPLPPVIGPR
jgi:hypothetical protein